jgi:hypothetical protein
MRLIGRIFAPIRSWGDAPNRPSTGRLIGRVNSQVGEVRNLRSAHLPLIIPEFPPEPSQGLARTLARHPCTRIGAIVSTKGGAAPAQARWVASQPARSTNGTGRAESRRPSGPVGRPAIRGWGAARLRWSARAVLIARATLHSKSNRWIGVEHHVRDLSVVRRLVPSGVIDLCHTQQA